MVGKTMIICSHCKENVGTTNYAKNINKDGYITNYVHCPDCNSSRVKNYYKNNKERFRAIIKKSIDKYPEKQKARAKLNNAIRLGRIERPNECSNCHSTERRIEGDHHDYSKPLEVTWLCTLCHGQVERLRRLVK